MKRALPIIFLAAVALAFIFGLGWMLQVRMDKGDAYPPYSSLRSDPLGTMALYESLERLPGLTVSRDFSATNQLPAAHGSVYLHLGTAWQNWESLPEDLYREIQAFLGRGGRLVVVLNPEISEFSFKHAIDGAQKENTGKEDPQKTPPESKKAGEDGKEAKPAPKKSAETDKDTAKMVSLKDKWGLEFDFEALPYSEKDRKTVVSNVSGLDLPPQLDWRSGLHFGKLDPAWFVVYSRGDHPVVVERHFGTGTVVMATDGNFLNNAALRRERHTDLLAWIIGSGQQVVFDESHFGLVDMPGVAGLIRRYHLTGLVAAFLLLAVLFIWKNFSSLVPAYDGGRPEDFVQGRASSAGFVNLLRRNVPANEMLPLCFAEWKKSPAAARPGLKLTEVEAAMAEEQARPARQRNAVRLYARIVEILKRPAFSPVPPPPLSTPVKLP